MNKRNLGKRVEAKGGLLRNRLFEAGGMMTGAVAFLLALTAVGLVAGETPLLSRSDQEGASLTEAENIEGLMASGPASDLADKLDLYGQFVGSWELDWKGPGADGKPLEVRGEWHFGWVLDGRAIQDVWIAPTRSEHHESGRAYGEYGSTLRIYDPAIEAWRIVWVAPVKALVRTFIARQVGQDIVQEETASNGTQTRWVFSKITENSFHWSSLESKNGGKTWEILQEMDVRRITASENH